MIYDTSYYDRPLRKEINELVGQPFSLLDRLKLKGIGSPRFILRSSSDDIRDLLPTDESIVNTSIELRPKGIIVHFKKFTEHFSWVIPYYKLTLYLSRDVSLYENGTFMKFSKNSLKKSQLDFIKKVSKMKAHFMKDLQPI